jgi:hypothetical protein
MNKIILTAAIFFLFSFATFNLVAQEKYTLKNRFPQGKYEMRLETDMDTTVKIGDQTIPNHFIQTQYQEIVAGPIAPDGSQQVTMEIKRVVIKNMIGGRKIEFDSADEKASLSPFKMFGIMVGFKATMTTDRDGKVMKFEGLDEFWEKRAQTFPKRMLEMQKKQFSDKSLTKMFGIMHEAMPQQSVAVGEQWKSEGISEVPIIGKVKMKQTNTLKEIQLVDETELAVIVSQSRIKSDTPQEVEIAAIKTTLKSMDIDSESIAQMEIKTGLMVSSVTQIKMNIEAETTINNQTTQQNMTGEGKTSIIVTHAEK